MAKWLCDDCAPTRTVRYNRPCPDCTGYQLGTASGAPPKPL